MKTSKKLEKIPPYLFQRIDKKKAEAKEKGIDLIDFGVGDPDLTTPIHIINKMKEAITDPKYHNYPPYEGMLSFRKAVAGLYLKRFGVKLDPEKEVLSLIGSKEGFAHIFQAFLDPGDISLVPNPAYRVYEMCTLLNNGEPYFMPLLEENGFLPEFSKIEDKAIKKAKLMVINYPNNPTGAVADKEFLKEAVNFARKNEILLCMDLAYSEISYDGYMPPSILEIDGAKDVAIEFHSLSKTYNMTGWRIGMVVGNEKAISALGVVKSNIDSGIFKAIQIAGIEALTGPQNCIKEAVEIYRKRRDLFAEGLKELGFRFNIPKASFYFWVKNPHGYDSTGFAEYLLEKAGLVVVPGNGYGKYGEGYIRLTLTVPEEKIKEALNRLKNIKI